MKRASNITLAGMHELMGFILTLWLGLLAWAVPGEEVIESRPPRLFPDYAGVVMPPNVAPLNFVVQEPGTAYTVSIAGRNGSPIHLESQAPEIHIPIEAWRELLRTNINSTLTVTIGVKDAQAQWHRFEPLTNSVSTDPVDAYLAYRLLRPLYNTYYEMGIYQRDLASFAEYPVLENTRFERGCLNCHTFLNRDANTMAINIRTRQHSNPLLIARNGAVNRINRVTSYLNWHPSGKLLAFSMNKLSIFFHTTGENRDVFDANSNLGVYDLDANVFLTPPALNSTNVQENWPCWSPDGRHLYYCAAPVQPIQQFREVRYDLMRIAFDPEARAWGEPEVVLAAKQTGRSMNQPRISPDGRWLVFCISEYGNFPIYQTSSDLHIMDLSTRTTRKLELNSDQSDSWHCWSGNGRWLVFSSKRIDGLFARPYFSHIDAEGHASKPFVLPQENPAFYLSFIKTYNVPEFVNQRIAVTQDDLAAAILKPRQAPSTSLDSTNEAPATEGFAQ